MKFFLRNQKSRYPRHLKDSIKKSVLHCNRSELQEKCTRIDLEHTHDLTIHNLKFLQSYPVFPKHILDFYAQWEEEERTMQVGDTIVQQVFLPPFSKWSLKLIMSVRIKEMVYEPSRISFRYETLEGHAEKGISSFLLEQIGGKTYFTIHTFSTPGNRLSTLVKHIFTLPYQKYCTRCAVKNVKFLFSKKGH